MGMIDSDNKETTVIPESTGEIAKSGDDILLQADQSALYGFFDVDKRTGEEMDKQRVQDIHQCLTRQGIPPDKQELHLRRIEMRLGGPNIGETRLGKLWRYIRLDTRVMDTLQEMKQYESNNT